MDMYHMKESIVSTDSVTINSKDFSYELFLILTGYTRSHLQALIIMKREYSP